MRRLSESISEIVVEFRRRRLFRPAAIYFAVAWAASEVLKFIFEAWMMPAWTISLLATLFVVGFPVAMFLAWTFEIGPAGVRRTAPSSTRGELSILAALVLLIGGTAGLFYLIDPVKRFDQPAVSYTDTLELPVRSIAVLPFQDLSFNSDTSSFFVDGIHEDILIRLSRIESIEVISRTSVTAYRGSQKTVTEIGRELGAGKVLEGSVQRVGDRLRFSVQLIDANKDQHLWGESYDRHFTAQNIFDIQSEISESVAEKLDATLSQQEVSYISEIPTEDLATYQLYLQGRFALHRRGDFVAEAIEILDRVVAMDPTFARAWATLGSAYAVAPNWINMPRDIADPLAQDAARKAIELDDTLGQPHAFLAGINEERWNWMAAEEGFRDALAREPNNAQIHQWYGELLYSTGRLSDAYAEIQKAGDLDPLSPLINLLLGYVYSYRNENELTTHHASIAHDLGINSWQLHKILATAYLRENQVDEAKDELTAANKIGGPGIWPPPIIEATIDPRQRPRALESLQEMRRKGVINASGLCYYSAFLGDLDQAYAAMPEMVQEQAINIGDFWLAEFRDFRRDSRFVDFARRSGLLDYWQEYEWPDLCRPVGDSIECE